MGVRENDIVKAKIIKIVRKVIKILEMLMYYVSIYYMIVIKKISNRPEDCNTDNLLIPSMDKILVFVKSCFSY